MKSYLKERHSMYKSIDQAQEANDNNKSNFYYGKTFTCLDCEQKFEGCDLNEDGMCEECSSFISGELS